MDKMHIGLQGLIKYYENKQTLITEAYQHAHKLDAEFNAEMRSEFGIGNGDKIDTFQLIKAMAIVNELSKKNENV